MEAFSPGSLPSPHSWGGQLLASTATTHSFTPSLGESFILDTDTGVGVKTGVKVCRCDGLGRGYEKYIISNVGFYVKYYLIEVSNNLFSTSRRWLLSFSTFFKFLVWCLSLLTMTTMDFTIFYFVHAVCR